MKPRKIILLAIIGASVVLVLHLLGVFEKKDAPSTPGTSVWEIFGRPDRMEESGAVMVEYQQPDCIIHYNFYPRGKSEYEKELGLELASKLKKLFEKDERIGNVFVTIFGLFTDTYGNTGWKPVLYFEFDRETFNSISWNRLIKQDLLEVVKNLKWFRKDVAKKS